MSKTIDHKAHAIARLRGILSNLPLVPLVHFVSMGKPVRGGTHQRVKMFVIENGSMMNITGSICSAMDLKFDTYDLSTVVHRDTLIFYNLGQIEGLERFRDAEISWQ